MICSVRGIDLMNERIRKLRKALGLSQVEFARKIGRHPGFVSSLESGKIRYNTCDLRISFCVRGMGRICRRETGMRRLENGIIRASADILNRIAGFYGIGLSAVSGR